MKQTALRFLMALVAGGISVVFTGCSSNELPEQNKDMARAEVSAVQTAFSSSITLNLCDYTVTPEEATVGLNLAVDRIRGAGQVTLAIVNPTVNFSHVQKFSTEIYAIHNQSHCARMFPGIEIIVGMKEDAIKLYYRKLCLCTSTSDLNVESTFTVTPVSQFLTYTSTGFVNATDAEARIAEYQSKLSIKKNNGRQRSFNHTDTRSVIIPVKKLEAVVKHAAGNNVVRFQHYGIPSDSGAKQSLLLSAERVTFRFLKDLIEKGGQKEYLSTASSKFANRSHLCPDNCNEIMMVMTPTTSTDCNGIQ